MVTKPKMPPYILEIIMNILYQQNIQMIKTIAEEEDVPLYKIAHIVPSPYKIKEMIKDYVSSSSSSDE